MGELLGLVGEMILSMILYYLHEEFLYCHSLVEIHILRLVSIAKAATTDVAHYFVFASLYEGI